MSVKQIVMAAAGQAGGEALYVDDVFSTYLYTGNGVARDINNNVDLAGEGGLVWIKLRSTSTGFTFPAAMFDTERGALQHLRPSTTNASTNYNNSLTAFNSNGFSLGADSSTGLVNYGTGANTYVSWTFRKAPKFFDVVTYTGNGVIGRTITHGLSSVPGCIIWKQTSASGENWGVWHRSFGDPSTTSPYTGTYIQLNLTAQAANFTNRLITIGSTDVTIGSNSEINANGSTYVMYFFAHDAGGFGADGSENVISCGSYTGNGSTAGPIVSLGFEPQWVMIKASSKSGDSWRMFDVMRGMDVNTSGSGDGLLSANSTSAEVYTTRLSPTATGFGIVDTAPDVNTSGATYIYIAIRRPNKPPTSGTEVFNPTLLYQYDINGNTSSGNGIHGYLGNVSDMYIQLYRSGSSLNALNRSRLSGNGYLVTSSTAAEVAGTTNFWDNNVASGFVSTNSVNTTIGTLNFRRAPGFFDVVCYTGTGVARTVAHNLAAVPELMIIKDRSSTNAWSVNAAILGTSGNILNLSTTGAAITSSTPYNSTAPTDSVFTVGVAGGTNSSGLNYVAYLFATLPGISKVGSYTGNGTSQTIDCGFTAGARFVLVKRTDSTGNWFVWDSARGINPAGTNDPYLLLNSTAAEVTTNDSLSSQSVGFGVIQNATTNINVNAASYIFLAIA